MSRQRRVQMVVSHAAGFSMAPCSAACHLHGILSVASRAEDAIGKALQGPARAFERLGPVVVVILSLPDHRVLHSEMLHFPNRRSVVAICDMASPEKRRAIRPLPIDAPRGTSVGGRAARAELYLTDVSH